MRRIAKIAVLLATSVVCAVTVTAEMALPQSRQVRRGGSHARGDVRLPRLAILNRGGAPTLEDLLFEKLAKIQHIVLVERAQIALILKEYEVSLVSSDHGVALGKLLKADALLLIESQPELTHLVLTEAARAERLLDMAVAIPESSYEAVAEEAVARIAGLSLFPVEPPTQWLSIAVLPFEHDPQFDKWSDIGAFRTVLQSYLVTMPGIILAERDHMTQVLRERDDELARSVPAADFLLRGQSALVSKNTVRVDLHLRPTLTDASDDTVSYELTKAGFADSVPMIAFWIAGAVKARQGPRRDAAAEASLHYTKARAARAGDGSDPFYAFELAHLLAPENTEHAEAYRAALCRRMKRGVSPSGQKIPFIERLECFSRAMDLARQLDARRDKPCVPLPALMLSASTELVEPLSHGVAVLPVHDTRAPRIGEGRKTTRWISALLSETPAFRVVDERVVEEAIDALGLRSGSYEFMRNDNVARLATHLDVKTVIKAGLYGSKPVSLHFSIIGGCRSFNGNFTGSYTWDPHREGFVSTARQIAGLLDKNLGYGDHTLMVTRRERERYLACRRQAKSYYEWYCDLEHGLPDPAKRSLFLRSCPALHDSPEEALSSLRLLLERYGANADVLTDSMFPRVEYWDTRRAATLWREFCKEVAQ